MDDKMIIRGYFHDQTETSNKDDIFHPNRVDRVFLVFSVYPKPKVGWYQATQGHVETLGRESEHSDWEDSKIFFVIFPYLKKKMIDWLIYIYIYIYVWDILYILKKKMIVIYIYVWEHPNIIAINMGYDWEYCHLSIFHYGV